MNDYTLPKEMQYEIIENMKPNYQMSFHNGSDIIGKLDFNGPELVFVGNAEESAKVFVDWVGKVFYGRLQEEQQRSEKLQKALLDTIRTYMVDDEEWDTDKKTKEIFDRMMREQIK